MDLDRFFLFISYKQIEEFQILEVGQVMILRKGKPRQESQQRAMCWPSGETAKKNWLPIVVTYAQTVIDVGSQIFLYQIWFCTRLVMQP